jgi:hypothetical protein
MARLKSYVSTPAGHFDEGESSNLPMLPSEHPLDGEEARREHAKLLDWFYTEGDDQAANRLEMATDHNFYDNEQYSDEEKVELAGRSQLPIVMNEVAVVADWLIGTERRNRVDWSIKPRTENDVEMADVKTKVMKYFSDANQVQFSNSRAFADAIKGGIGWTDDGVRDDPTQEIIYGVYQNWRHVLYDSRSQELDISDARYVFRWRYVDEDIAMMMCPGREQHVRAACEAEFDNDDEFGLDQLPMDANSEGAMVLRTGTGRIGGARYSTRRRAKIIECQYRKPAKMRVLADGAMKGALFDERDRALVQHVAQNNTRIIDKVAMRVHVAVFTERAMLAMAPSPVRHNRFTLTPVFCYRRSRDNAPYGAIRRVRDVQRDLNKRASKALFMLSTNQIVADEGAVDDWNVAVEEAAKPDGLIIKKQGKEFTIRRDSEGANGQINLMELDARAIQKSAGVSQENLGRQTNAVSGEAIKARQLQGSVVTTEPFDNFRYANEARGQKRLSLIEQYVSEEKVIRLTEHRGALSWVKINEPQVQPDGSVRFLNDITSSMADFKVDEQDYSGTLRAVMFESMNNLAGRLPPELAMRLLTMAYEFSDLPNKDAIAEQFRKMTGERDPNKEMTPEEQQAQQQQAQQQAESLEMQRQLAIAALDEQRAKAREINARAAQLEAQASGGQGEQSAPDDVRPELAAEIERLSAELADTRIEIAHIEAATKKIVAEIQADSNARLANTRARLEASGAKQADTSPNRATLEETV